MDIEQNKILTNHTPIEVEKILISYILNTRVQEYGLIIVSNQSDRLKRLFNIKETSYLYKKHQHFNEELYIIDSFPFVDYIKILKLKNIFVKCKFDRGAYIATVEDIHSRHLIQEVAIYCASKEYCEKYISGDELKYLAHKIFYKEYTLTFGEFRPAVKYSSCGEIIIIPNGELKSERGKYENVEEWIEVYDKDIMFKNEVFSEYAKRDELIGTLHFKNNFNFCAIFFDDYDVECFEKFFNDVKLY